jgi:hypothetical protein
VKLTWNVYVVKSDEEGRDLTVNAGYGESPAEALADLRRSLEQASEAANAEASAKLEAIARVRGELAALDG